MGFRVKAKLPNQALTALTHSLVHQISDGWVGDALYNCPVAPQRTQIGTNGVAAIQGKEFSLNIGGQVVHKTASLNAGQFAFPASLLHIPLGILLHRHIQRIFKRCFGDNTVYGTVGKAHILLGIGNLLLAQMGKDRVPQLAGAPHRVLTGHNVEQLSASHSLSSLNPGGNGFCHNGQDPQAHRCGNQLTVPGDGVHQLLIRGRNSADVGNGPLGTLPVLNVDSVALPLVDGGDEVFCHVSKCDMIAALLQQGSDEPPPDVSRTDHNCLFHVLSLPFFSFLGTPVSPC